jgi:hypothetical protein
MKVYRRLNKSGYVYTVSVNRVKIGYFKAMPTVTRPLIATRVVQTTARTFPVISGLSDVISFTLRTGTQEGIRTHLLRVETHRELSSWVKSIINCTYDACLETGKVTARMLFKFAFKCESQHF